ncbi:hypothetical protein LOTGIDRAFT_155326 [Lottia gigantea]|uniref:Death domain-containing protein n=1 Tax=Lottia gigantea TaxID=225164 RepID=V4B687_LOTGI|nr:hypothetical protein LOTGIDRAFT_155326 [Lottia gigantea]ESO84014.1 hypothetical protein LOTGIDRAFT_155326 [Lottia gigantea]
MATRLNPVIDYRMPTLIGKAGFNMSENVLTTIPRPRGVVHLEAAPPRNLREVRKMMRNEIKMLTKRLMRLERLYYGGQKTLHDEIETYLIPIKSVMRAVLIFDLNKSSNVDEIFVRAGKPKQYRPNKSDLIALKEVYLKLQTFLPSKLSDTIASCEKLVTNLDKYCISFYDRNSDGYLGSAANFELQIEKWRNEIKNHISNAKTVFMRLKGNDRISLDTSHLCPPVRQFAETADCCNVLFLVIFADAVSNIRGALLLMNSWMKADENYGSYVKADAKELEKVKEQRTCTLRESKDRFHSLTFKLYLAESDLQKITDESRCVEEKLQPLKEEELSLIQKIRELDITIEFKEKKMAQIRKESRLSDTCALPEYYELIEDELKDLKDRLPIMQRQLSGIQYKIHWLVNKKNARDKLKDDVKKLKKQLSDAEEQLNSSVNMFEETRQSVDVARRIALCKNTNDSAEKLYYDLPFGPKSDRDKLPLSGGRPINTVCAIIADNIEKDWMKLYRNLPFVPARGCHTIEKDISKINESRERDEILAKQALKRWQRHHTRTKIEDLKSALKKIRRFDILRMVNAELAIPDKDIKERDLEDQSADRDPELIPYLKQVELFDKLRAAGKI